jgi:hypothetical protein
VTTATHHPDAGGDPPRRAPNVPATAGEARNYMLKSALPELKVVTLYDVLLGRPPRVVQRGAQGGPRR